MCDCLAESGKHHHEDCPKYATEKFPYLLYYEDTVDGWVITPEYLENIVVTDQLDVGEEQEIRFKRVDMTDKEHDELPEAD